MPDFSPEIITKAGDAVAETFPGLGAETGRKMAALVLDAVAEDLGEAVAAKILAHMERNGPGDHVPLPRRVKVARHMRRLHFDTAARVAARAFLSEDDRKRLAVQALAAGQFAWCPSLEDGDEH